MDKKQNQNFINKYNIKWVVIISLWTFMMAMILSIITEGLVYNLDILLAIIILIIIILIGIIFDIIGISVTSAEEKPFHSMAANRIREAKYAIKLVRNAGEVSNFCNDVIGDISGIISGAVGATIIYRLIGIYDIKNGSILSIIITSLIAALTVGGKALGKTIAILYSEKIIFQIAKMFSMLSKRFKLDLLLNKNKGNRNDK